LNVNAAMASGDTITIAGLTGTATNDAAALTIGGADAAKFTADSTTSRGGWTQSTGTLVLTANTGKCKYRYCCNS